MNKSDHKLLARCFRTACTKLLEQDVNYGTCNKHVGLSKTAARLTTEGCKNFVIISMLLLGQPSLIIHSSLLEVVNSLFQTCCQLGTNSAKTTCRAFRGTNQ